MEVESMNEYKPHIVKRDGIWKMDFSKCTGRQLMRYEQQRKREAVKRCDELNAKIAAAKAVQTPYELAELIRLGWIEPNPLLSFTIGTDKHTGKVFRIRYDESNMLPKLEVAFRRKVADFALSLAFPGQAHCVLECGHAVTIKFESGDKIPVELNCRNCKE